MSATQKAPQKYLLWIYERILVLTIVLFRLIKSIIQKTWRSHSNGNLFFIRFVSCGLLGYQDDNAGCSLMTTRVFKVKVKWENPHWDFSQLANYIEDWVKTGEGSLHPIDRPDIISVLVSYKDKRHER
jgi:hypothetical protein